MDRPDGTRRLWSSGTQRRLRTRQLRRDPRCTLFVFDAPMRWLGLETILDGSGTPALHLPLFRTALGLGPGADDRLGRPRGADEELVAMMAAEERLIYEFQIHTAYGATRQVSSRPDVGQMPSARQGILYRRSMSSGP